jgi:hypothetical protein
LTLEKRTVIREIGPEDRSTGTRFHRFGMITSWIDATDRQIDRLVYELYGLTDEEIRIVEEATSS